MVIRRVQTTSSTGTSDSFRVRLNLQIQVKKASPSTPTSPNLSTILSFMPSNLINSRHILFSSRRPRLAPPQPLHPHPPAIIIRRGRAPLHKTRGILRRRYRSMGRSRMRTIMSSWGLIIRWIWKVSSEGALRDLMGLRWGVGGWGG
jgi:hypothetical protein